MENFIYAEKYYSDLGELIDDITSEAEVKDLPDDWCITACETILEPILSLSIDWIMDRIDEERFSEDGDEANNLVKALEKIDFKAVNDAMPKLHYGSRILFDIKKQDLLEYIK